jgi:hypothetical protein
MAISNALAWQLNNGGSADTLYGIIRDFLATSPDAATTQAQMAQYGISGEDVANATGGASGGLLGGNILAGASWNSLNPTLAGQLTEATGQATSNYSVGGATTADTLAQLNTFLAGGGQFDPNATVYLQTGGVDFLQGVDKGTIKDNINQIVKALGAQGVDVVLTGSPYAKSIDDVISNNFDPKVDSLFTEIAKENKNVALVGIQGEILQNKALLIDALHTNAEGTSIYNQAVIDSLSQFKNEVPSSTPQAIAQVYQTDTVATTPPIITQAAASPPVAQALATQNVDSLIKAGNLNPAQIAAATGVSVGEIVTQAAALAPFQGSTKLGDTYVSPNYEITQSGEEQIVGGLQSISTSKVSSEQGSRTELYSPTGELTNVGKYDKGPSFFGGLADALNDPVVQAAFLGLGGGGFLGNQLGLSGSAAQAVGTGVFKGGAAAAGGASLEDALKTGLLSGGLVYGGNLLGNYLDTGSTADVGLTERQFAVADAKNLASQGLSTTQIADTLAAGGYNEAIIDRAITAITPTNVATTPVAVSTPDTVNITAPTTPSLSNVLSTIAAAAAPVAVSTPVTDTVKVTGTTQPQMTNQEVINLVNSQLATNVTTPTNLANVQITGDRPSTIQDTINTIAATIPATSAVTQPIAQQTITGQQPATKQELIDVITATIPSVTPAQAAVVAEQVIISGANVSVNDAVSALTAAIPTITTPTVTTPTTVPTTTITAPRPTVTTQDVINTIAATIPTVTTPTTIPTTTITADKPVTTQEVINAITAAIPTVTTPTTVPTTTITADRPVVTPETINAITAAIPSVTAPTTLPTTTITAAQTPTTVQDLINTIAATVPAVIPTTPDSRVTITADRPSSITDAVTAATIPLIQPTTPLTVPQVTAQTPVDPLRVAQLGLTAAGLLGAGSALSGGSTATQYPVVPVPESWTTPITGTTGTTGTTAYSQLPAINFGDRNLLRGTQWEKFLSPTYGQVPAPVQYSQPSNLSYNDLMGILGSKQGMPPASSLSINDIISGIQNQYGQAPARTMG